MTRLPPGLCLLHGRDEDHPGHLSEEAMFCSQAEKLVGKYQSIHWVPPTHQALHAHDFAGRQSHLGLIVVDQFPMSDGGAQLFYTVRMLGYAARNTTTNVGF